MKCKRGSGKLVEKATLLEVNSKIKTGEGSSNIKSPLAFERKSLRKGNINKTCS